MTRRLLLAAFVIALAAVLAASVSATPPGEPPAPDPWVAPDGAVLFSQRCAPCHGASGEGVASQIPPLAGSDYLKADLRRAVSHVIKGLEGEITVNGNRYASAMPSHGFLSDDEIAAVLSHVLSAYNGETEPVTASMVASVRREVAGQPEVAACPCGGRGCGAMAGCGRGAASMGACGMGGGRGCGMDGGRCALMAPQGDAHRHRRGLGR